MAIGLIPVAILSWARSFFIHALAEKNFISKSFRSFPHILLWHVPYL